MINKLYLIFILICIAVLIYFILVTLYFILSAIYLFIRFIISRIKLTIYRNKIISNSMKYIYNIFIDKYKLSDKEANKIIRKSHICNLIKYNLRMSIDGSLDVLAELLYKHYN